MKFTEYWGVPEVRRSSEERKRHRVVESHI